MQAYDHLARWFEILNDDCDYPTWSQYFIEGLRAAGAGRKGLELGCGSGAFTRALAKAGFDMTGADLSVPMLDRAVRLSAEEGVRAEFVRADAATVRTPVRYDFILSPNDCYNYLPPEKLPAAFRRAAGCLKRGGLFWFDVSSPRKLRQKVADTVSVDDRDGVTYLAFSFQEEGRVRMEVSLFEKGKDGRYDRFDETHVLYIHEEEAILSALRAAGFTVLREEGHLGGTMHGSDRWNFLCKL